MVIKNASVMNDNFKTAISGLLKKDLLVAISLDLLTSIDEINRRIEVIEKQKVLLGEKHLIKNEKTEEFVRDSSGNDYVYKSPEDKKQFFAEFAELQQQTFEITLKEKIPVSKSKDRMSVVDIALLRDEFIEIVD